MFSCTRIFTTGDRGNIIACGAVILLQTLISFPLFKSRRPRPDNLLRCRKRITVKDIPFAYEAAKLGSKLIARICNRWCARYRVTVAALSSSAVCDGTVDTANDCISVLVKQASCRSKAVTEKTNYEYHHLQCDNIVCDGANHLPNSPTVAILDWIPTRASRPQKFRN